MIVDSSVWVDYFNGRDTPQARRLTAALVAHETVALLDLVLAEVLQGFRDDGAFDRAREALTALPRPRLGTSTYIGAARLFRRLRRRGVTVRGTIDCIVAQACLELDAPLLARDSDFAAIARHSELRMVAC